MIVVFIWELSSRRKEVSGVDRRRPVVQLLINTVNVALGPVVGPVGRLATMGRTFEGFGSDPYIAGTLAAETIRGMQENVIACIKHLVGYEQETNRVPIGDNTSISSNIDDKTMHELYFWPFMDAVHAGVGSAMGSYNKVNGSYSCQNSKVMNGLLKTEAGFQGVCGCKLQIDRGMG